MTELVPTEEIEAIVGEKRHPSLHLARRTTQDGGRTFVLHSTACKNHYADLRDCEISVALDEGAPSTPYSAGETVAVAMAGGWLIALPRQWALDALEEAGT